MSYEVEVLSCSPLQLCNLPCYWALLVLEKSLVTGQMPETLYKKIMKEGSDSIKDLPSFVKVTKENSFSNGVEYTFKPYLPKGMALCVAQSDEGRGQRIHNLTVLYGGKGKQNFYSSGLREDKCFPIGEFQQEAIEKRWSTPVVLQ